MTPFWQHMTLIQYSVMASSNDNDEVNLHIVSYNMHGFHQGYAFLEDLCSVNCPDVLLLQEHWLTPDNLFSFDKYFSNFFSFGCSAMRKTVESGMLRGRPFGGVMMLIKDHLRNHTETVKCDDRYTIVRIGNLLIVNVYLPCCGTEDRVNICKDMLLEIEYWLQYFNWCHYVIAGDFNCTLDGTDPVADLVTLFIDECSLVRCDKLVQSDKQFTYFNETLNQYSYIDYALVSSGAVSGSATCKSSLRDFVIMDPAINFSDHLPISMSIACNLKARGTNRKAATSTTPRQYFPRWDKGDLNAFYYFTGDNFMSLIKELDVLSSSINCEIEELDKIYERIVAVLAVGENLYIPRCSKNYFKFWWSEELTVLKQAAIDTDRLWKAAGKPRSGQIFDNRQKSRLVYRKRIRECERSSSFTYTNELHEALLKKNGPAFWKCWRANFEPASKCVEVESSVNPDVIVQKFVSHFSSAYTPNDAERSKMLRSEYERLRASYSGFPLTDDHVIDTELVSNVVSGLHTGKAVDIAGLTAEHLIYSHPSLCVVLCKLFQLIMRTGSVPLGFRQSYIVPIPKLRDCRVKSLSCDDFRGIAISPIISKVFEHCLLNRFDKYFTSCDTQFGFKKGFGCGDAIFTVRKIVDRLVKCGSSVNICAIDLTKAFDKVNHSALFMKLMKRHIPIELLILLENWLSDCYACVKWTASWSHVFKVTSGVRQGSVLSPFLFAVYVDELGNLYNARQGTFIVLYADDILLLAPSIVVLQGLLRACEDDLSSIDMHINTKKSACLRIGPRHDKICATISTHNGCELSWVDEIRYLGVFIVRSTKFKCSIDHAKRNFFRSANGIFGKVGRSASEEVTIQLLLHKCMPILLYGLDVCALDNRSLQSLDFTVNRFFMKLFRTSDMAVVRECQSVFGFDTPSVALAKRFNKFVEKYASGERCTVCEMECFIVS